MRIFLAKGANKNPAIHPAIQVTKSGCVHLGARMQMARRSRYYKSSIDTELECPSARLNRCNGCPATATNISVFVSVSVVKSFGQNFYFFSFIHFARCMSYMCGIWGELSVNLGFTLQVL